MQSMPTVSKRFMASAMISFVPTPSVQIATAVSSSSASTLA
jgi:hypothetical protein